MNPDDAYVAEPPLSLLSHWGARTPYAGDYVDVDVQRIKAQIESGDYFVTLATKLEVLSQRLATQKNESAEDLEKIANELLFLQNYYSVSEKANTL